VYYLRGPQGHTKTETIHAARCLLRYGSWGEPCVYPMVQRREKEKDSRYIQEASAPAAVTVYQTCNIMYICNIVHEPSSSDAS